MKQIQKIFAFFLFVASFALLFSTVAPVHAQTTGGLVRARSGQKPFDAADIPNSFYISTSPNSTYCYFDSFNANNNGCRISAGSGLKMYMFVCNGYPWGQASCDGNSANYFQASFRQTGDGRSPAIGGFYTYDLTSIKINPSDITECDISFQIDVINGQGQIIDFMVYHSSNPGNRPGCGIGITPTTSITPTPVLCTPLGTVGCTNDGPSKWRTQLLQTPGTQTTNQTGVTCTNGQTFCYCPQNTTACFNTRYVNSAPRCSITNPSTTRVNRPSAGNAGTPIAATLNVSDNDYGDTLNVINYSVNNQCASVKFGGTDIQGKVVKVGSNNPADTSNSIPITVDQNDRHGIYTFNPVTGRYECSGTVNLQIADGIGDAGDSQDIVNCTFNFTVSQDAPTISGVGVFSKDPNGTGLAVNQINGINLRTYIAGQAANRTGACNNPVSIDGNGNITCPSQNITYKVNNPVEISYTVSDPNGVNDIEYTGIWLQRTSTLGSSAPNKPLVVNGIREAYPALYSDYRYNNLLAISQSHLTSLAPLTQNLKDYFNLSGLRLMNSGEKYQFSPFNSWLLTSFPDCLGTSANCTINNVPAASRSLTNGDPNNWAAYAWDVNDQSAPNTYVCYNNSPQPQLKTSCDSSCSVCIKRAQTAFQSTSATSMKVAFQVQFNESAQEGDYALFANVTDKLGVGNWYPVQPSGSICPFVSGCPTPFLLTLDKTPPTFDVSYLPNGLTGLTVKVANVTDNSNSFQSGIATYGLARVASYKDIGGVKTNRAFLTKLPVSTPSCPIDGTNTCFGFPTGGGFNYNMGDISSGDKVHTQVCLFDNAGNSTCKMDPYDSLGGYSPILGWLKSSLGTVYSGSDSSKTGFNMQLASPAPGSTGGDEFGQQYLSGPFKNQGNVAIGGLYASGSSLTNSGIAGGLVFASQSLAGYKGNPTQDCPTTTSGYGCYRAINEVNLFNRKNYIDTSRSLPGSNGWYSRLKFLADYNCSLTAAETGGTACKDFNWTQTPGTRSNLVSILITALADTSVKNKRITMSFSSVYPDAEEFTNLTCVGNNIIFLTAPGLNAGQVFNYKFRGQLKKLTPTSNCIFVADKSVKFSLTDTPSQTEPHMDYFEGSIISDGDFSVEPSLYNTADGKFDSLLINGMIYTTNKAPQFLRNLDSTDNQKKFSEWLIFDPNVYDQMRFLLGNKKYVDLKCGVSNHPLCTAP